SRGGVGGAGWDTAEVYLGAVRPRRLRRTDSNGSSSAASTLRSLPLMSRVMVAMMSFCAAGGAPYPNSGPAAASTSFVDVDARDLERRCSGGGRLRRASVF